MLTIRAPLTPDNATIERRIKVRENIKLNLVMLSQADLLKLLTLKLCRGALSLYEMKWNEITHSSSLV